MNTNETGVMALFGALVIGGLILALRQGARQREQFRAFAAGHGVSYTRAGDSAVSRLLDEAMPDVARSVQHAVTLEPPPERVVLFSCTSRPRSGSASSSTSVACLAEHTGPACEAPVTISPRIPGLDRLTGNRVEAGGEELRRQFIVASTRPECAGVVVSPDVERLVLEHRAGPGWYLTVTIANRVVLVESSWAKTPGEWEYLVALTRKLRVAVSRLPWS